MGWLSLQGQRFVRAISRMGKPCLLSPIFFRTGNYLSGEMRDFDFSGGEMPFPRNELPGSCILELVDVPQREFCYVDPPSGRWVIVDLSDVPYLTQWSDGGPFLCIEPC